MLDQVFDCYAQNENHEWISTNCTLNKISNLVLNSWISSNTPDNIQRKKKNIHAYQWEIFKVLIWNKHVLSLAINETDVLIGSESHLSSTIMNSEILSKNYTAPHNDCNVGYGGVKLYIKNIWWWGKPF